MILNTNALLKFINRMLSVITRIHKLMAVQLATVLAMVTFGS